MKKVFLLLLAVIISGVISAHPWKSQHYIIIDTDCGLDDYRALCLLMASEDVRILAITTSDGVLDARSGYVKVRSLLNELHHQGILTGMNYNGDGRSESCKPAMELKWGIPDTAVGDPPDAVSIIEFILKNTDDNITFLNLGSLNTIRRCYEEIPGFANRVKDLAWSCSSDMNIEDFNYALDIASAKIITGSELPVRIVHTASFSAYDEDMVSHFHKIPTLLAGKLAGSMAGNESSHAKSFYDEILPIYVLYPDMFTELNKDGLIISELTNTIKAVDIEHVLSEILLSKTEGKGQVLDVFPLDTSFYYSDIQTDIVKIINKYGLEEWMAGVLANEMHRHLGVYAVIGVKMGIRAKEYFGAGIDEMRIVSYAGVNPPFSCMNDGLQVSTGATLGHGLIRIFADSLKLPQADFTYLNQTIRLVLKPEYRRNIETEISEYNKIYGLNSDIYWDLVRKAAIKYWFIYNRHNIFDIEIIQ